MANKTTVSQSKNMGKMHLTGGRARCVWMFCFDTREDCMKMMWNVMNNPDLIEPTLTWRNMNGRLVHYSKAKNPGGKMGVEENFYARLGEVESEKYLIRADVTDRAFKGKKDRAKRMCFIWYPQKNDKYLFLNIGGKEELSKTEDKILKKVANKSNRWIRREVAQ